MKIRSEIQYGGDLTSFAPSFVKTEPMLHRADWNFALKHGGELTYCFLDSLALHWGKAADVLIDSRVHMLMPGQFPCIPGWHHDDVPRERVDKQPNYDNPSYKAEHCMALWGDCSLTEFALGEHEIEIPPIGQKIYKVLSPQIEALCLDGKLKRVIAPSEKLIFFNYHTWHRGAETTKTGFRFFIRATRNSKLEARNEIRYNANVYMPVLDEGW